MPVRSYIIVRDLIKMSKEWETMPEFQEYVAAIKELAPPPPPSAEAPTAPEAGANTSTEVQQPVGRRSARSRTLSTLGQIMQDQRAAEEARRQARAAEAATAVAVEASNTTDNIGEGDGVEEQDETNVTGDANAEDVITDEGFFRRSSEAYAYNEIKAEIKMFFEVAIKMAKKHFSRWVGDLLHCGLAGEKESATALARSLAGLPVEGTYDSATHGCAIDLGDMMSYLVEDANVNVDEVKGRKFVIDNWNATSNYIADGQDLWLSTIPSVQAMKADAQTSILPLASSTHRVEAQVRECSLVSSTNRGEVKRSDYIIQRSTNTSFINREANKTREGRILHANASVTAGMQGQRQTQSGGPENPKKKIRQTVRGEPRTIVQLNNAKERCQNLNRIRGVLVKQKKLKDALKTKNENRSDVARATAQANEFRRKHLLERAPNKRQRERGVDRTYLVVGRIPYKVLRATIPEHMDLLQAELVHRGADPANIPAGCRDRIKMLKELENDKKSFRAKTPVNFEL